MEEDREGLGLPLYEAATEALSYAALAFLLQDPLDHSERVISQQGSLVKQRLLKRGRQTINAFAKSDLLREGTSKFACFLSKNRPELTGYMTVLQSCTPMGDGYFILAYWASIVAQLVEAGMAVGDAVSRVLDQVDELIKIRSVLVRRVAFISGLELPERIDELSLAENLSLRRITQHDRDDLKDIPDSVVDAITAAETSIMIVAHEQVPCAFTIEPTGSIQASPSNAIAPVHSNLLLKALHIINSGRAAILFEACVLLPNVLPPMGERGRYIPHSPRIRRAMALSKNGVDQLPKILVSLAENRWQQIDTAASRLVESANRISPVDALVDSMIGLDVLLDPSDRSELSFRAALNYAFLGASEDRYDRFHTLKRLQGMRGKILHAGVNLTPERISQLNESAESAQACLRDVLMRFLTDESLGQKKDSSFWLDRILRNPGGK